MLTIDKFVRENVAKKKVSLSECKLELKIIHDDLIA